MKRIFVEEFIVDHFEEKLLSVRVFIMYSNMSQFNPEVFMSKPVCFTI